MSSSSIGKERRLDVWSQLTIFYFIIGFFGGGELELDQKLRQRCAKQ